MIKSSDIMKLLKDKNADLSKEELENIIEEELKKDEKEMDADLIEMCLDALTEKELSPKKKKFSLFKAMSFVAAAAVLVFVVSAVIPKLTNRSFNNKSLEESTSSVTEATASQVTEKAETNKAAESKTKEFSSAEKISHDNISASTNPSAVHKEETTKIPSTDKSASTLSPSENDFESMLKKLLTDNGFDGAILPKKILENSQILNQSFDENKAEIRIKSKEKIYDISIEKSSEKFEEKNAIDVNGLKVSIESENNSSEIKYSKNNLNYKIVFESSYEEAVKIAKTVC